MNRYLPVQGRRWATAGLVLVSVMAICGTNPLWIAAAALILATILTAVLWKTPAFEPEQADHEK